jgi:hypothetical protein
MSDGIDGINHADEAKFLLECATGAAGRTDDIAVNAAAAQVHATLALVEQQRIANLIALAKLDPSWRIGGSRRAWLEEAAGPLGIDFPPQPHA